METVRNLLYSLIFGLIPLAGAVAEPDLNPENPVEKRRNIVKVFDVKGPDLLTVDNQYGQVKVNLWNKRDIRVEIIITANAPNEEKASEYLNAVEIAEKRTKSLITLTTNIDKNRFGRNFWNNRNGEKNFIQINYTIYMPKENPLIVKNKFGDTDIPSFQAALTVNARNGTFSADHLEGSENNIDVRYGNIRIGKMDEGKLDCQYSNLQLDQAKKLMLNNKFGELNIGDIINLDADIDYSGTKIGTIRGTGRIKLNYSRNFRINEVRNSSDNVNIQATYSYVVLPAEAKRFDVTVTGGKFSYPSDANFSLQPAAPSQKVKQYQGKVGTGAGGSFTVTSRYGDVKLKE